MPASPKYPPYVNAYGNLPNLFQAIGDASVPPKFTNNFMQTALGLKSTSFRAMIPLLKRLGFIDQNNVPTQSYKDFRDTGLSGSVMAERVREAYAELFNSNEYAHKLGKAELVSKLRTITGTSAEDKIIPSVAATFLELVKLSDFDGKTRKPNKKKDDDHTPKDAGTAADAPESPHSHPPVKLGISYTINLNLPPTTEIEVFNAIFKSLKEHILNEE